MMVSKAQLAFTPVRAFARPLALTVLLAAPVHIVWGQAKSVVDGDGAVQVPAFTMPPSDLSSAEAKRNFVDFARGFESLTKPPPKDAGKSQPSMADSRRRLDDLLMKPGVARLRGAFAVKIAPQTIAGVQTDVIEPVSGIAAKNAKRVLLNLHGGGFIVGARFGGQMESIPIASLGAIKVITVDYRMAPEYKFPAASEDVAKVYQELLKTYRPENIGIYGCSAGAMLTAQAVAWFQKHQLPRPGAVGMFGLGAVAGVNGDSTYLGAAIGGMGGAIPAARDPAFTLTNPYLVGADFNDPLVSPGRSPAVLAKFPPSLLISGTRDLGLSNTVYTHTQLVKAGADADLHVWEGAPHCSFAQPVVNPNEPESREAWDVIVKFFDKHLGSK